MILSPCRPYIDLIYAYGGFAVEIFWMISGVIFFVFYKDEIQARRISFSVFLSYRLSRLYPLHLVTLLSVTVLQWLYFRAHDLTFIYGNNDATHFLINVLMINFWNAKFGLSFNGPFWSVSVEMFVYLVFFVFSFIGLLCSTNNIIILTILFFIFYALGILSPFYECLLYFFAGTLLAGAIASLTYQRLFLLAVLIGIVLIGRHYNPILQKHFEVKRIVDGLIKLNISVLLVACFMKFLSNLNPWTRRIIMELGNLTYSVYMIHISIQLSLILLSYRRGESHFNSGVFMSVYLGTSLLLGYFVYKFFELPAQKFLRSFIKSDKQAAIAF